MAQPLAIAFATAALLLAALPVGSAADPVAGDTTPAGGVSAGSVSAGSESQDAAGTRFESEIRPLLEQKCGHCHGDRVQKGELNVTRLAALRVGGESGEPAIGETLDESPLWTFIEDGAMPPEGEPKLDPKEIERIRRWIESGEPVNALMAEESNPLNQHDVLPIVLLRCVTCHGPQRLDGGLDLRSRAAMIAGGDSGPALVPGDPDASLMIRRIESEACPPSHLLLKFFVRRPSTSEVETLRGWIASGAPEADVKPDVATTDEDPLVADRDRQHWAFQPLPEFSEDDGRNSIDHFIEHKLATIGLQLSPQADRDTLIRRAYIDLIGIPPTLEQWQRWRDHGDPGWYGMMIDHLLASPHYGERWGRYWLDLAGYADSEGGISADPIRAVAWKYRDYVIEAFNADKPYDRFLTEQLAGDELVDFRNAETVTAEMVDNLIATGFLRMGIDETGSRTMNFVPERLKVISDAITVVSSGLMGLTMECARCHSHKYDPIPQRDYYRLKAIFQGALDEHDWHSFKTRKLNVATDEHRRRVAETNPPLEKAIKQLESKKKNRISDVQLGLLRHHYPEQPEADHQETLRALRIADNNRTLPQRLLVERLQRAEVLPDDQQPESVLQARRDVESLTVAIDRLRRKLVPPLEIRALWDQGRPSPTYILARGEHTKPGRWVGPGVPSVLTDGHTPFDCDPPFPNGTPTTGRRLSFAKWLTSDRHPLTARVMVNRIWHHHFGTGLVKDLDNFGVMGERPTHPELLDWLAGQFVRSGWSIKQMHRLIMNSRTYRQTSRVTPDRQQHDPQNRLLSRMPMRRLDAESLRDSLLAISGRLDPTPGGIPDPVSVDRDGLVSVYPTEHGQWRRSVYLQYRRTETPTMMDTFDYPPMGPNCLSRNVSIVSPQALLLMNNEHVHTLAKSFASRVIEKVREDPTARVNTVYGMLLNRLPDDQERSLGITALSELTSRSGGSTDAALQTYCHTLINSAAFLYVD